MIALGYSWEMIITIITVQPKIIVRIRTAKLGNSSNMLMLGRRIRNLVKSPLYSLLLVSLNTLLTGKQMIHSIICSTIKNGIILRWWEGIILTAIDNKIDMKKWNNFGNTEYIKSNKKNILNYTDVHKYLSRGSIQIITG